MNRYAISQFSQVRKKGWDAGKCANTFLKKKKKVSSSIFPTNDFPIFPAQKQRAFLLPAFTHIFTGNLMLYLHQLYCFS